MTNLILKFNFSFLILISTLIGQNSNFSVVVLDFVAQGIKPKLATNLTNHFANELKTSNTMNMVNRDRMVNVFKDKGFDYIGCNSINCSVIAGHMLGVEQVIVGTIWKFENVYTIDAHIISVQYGKTLRSKRITYEGKMDGLIDQIKLLAWELVGLGPPERLVQKDEIRVYKSIIEEEKTKGGAVLRSMLLPGFGQFYSGKKVSAFSFVSAEMAMIIMAINRQSNFLSLKSDQGNIRALYDSSTEQEDINKYSTQLISIDKQIKAANSQLVLYTATAASVWALNVIHALVLDPSFNAGEKKTKGNALARSMLMPGFGQLYNGRKTAGYSFMGLEFALIGLTINSYSKSQSLKVDQEKVQESYLAATTPEDIRSYSDKLIDLDKKIKATNNFTSLFTVSIAGVWVANVVHAFVMGPLNNNDVSALPFTLVYDPVFKQTKIQWMVHF